MHKALLISCSCHAKSNSSVSIFILNLLHRRAWCWPTLIHQAWMNSNSIFNKSHNRSKLGSLAQLQFSSLLPTPEYSIHLQIITITNLSVPHLPQWAILRKRGALFTPTCPFPAMPLQQLCHHPCHPVTMVKCPQPTTLYCSLWVEDRRSKFSKGTPCMYFALSPDNSMTGTHVEQPLDHKQREICPF